MTLHSMTGFANVSSECGSKRINLEIRSVNHRFLDLQFKMPDDFRYLESQLRESIAKEILRGKVECRIQIQSLEQHHHELAVNHDLIHELAELNNKLQKKHKGLGKLSVADILRFPGVLSNRADDSESFGKAIHKLLAEALKEFVHARQREGKKLQEHILERLDAMEGIIQALSELFPHLLAQYLEKARTRLAEAVSNIDEDRLKQEFALYMQKADVDEEFSRLLGHINEVRRIVTEQKGSVGKRLDFLMQELNREANTLGSKAIAAECTQASVELKVLIEQMREQVQNIE